MTTDTLTPYTIEDVTTAEAVEPVSLEYVKEHCYVVSGNADDSLLESYLKAAREQVENTTGCLLRRRTLKMRLHTFPYGNDVIRLRRAPVAAVASVKYTDINDVEQTMSSGDYTVDLQRRAVILNADATWPTTSDDPNSVVIQYTAGYVHSACPQSLKAAIVQLVAHWYKNRESVMTGTVSKEIEMAYRMLTQAYKVRRVHQ